MLDVNTDIIFRLIDLAQEFHAQQGASIPETRANPSGDWAAQTLASHIDDMSFQEFKSIINDLEPAQQQQIVALFWVGREDYSLDEWEDVLEQAQDDWNTKTAEYLIAHPMLADHLRDGLEQFGYNGE